MHLSWRIAKRYLFSAKSHNAINIISGISVCGVALATMALICTLSVFNGFHDLVESMFTNFDPELKIQSSHDHLFEPTDSLYAVLQAQGDVAVITETLENNAMMQYRQHQTMVTIKGVSDNFRELTHFDDILYGEGEPRLADEVVDYGIMGIRIPYALGSGLFPVDAFTIYAPRTGTRVNLANPVTNFTTRRLYSPGVVFCVNQEKYDNSYVITSLDFARSLFGNETAVTALELKLAPGAHVAQVKRRLRDALGSDYVVHDRYEQQADVFKIVEIEKFVTWLFLSFILLIACFNIISSVSMLILDKRANVATLRHLGADDRLICRIFTCEGTLITFCGAIVGLLLGIILCLLQQRFGFISLGGGAAFVVDAYPVSLHLTDILLVFLTVVLVSSVSVRLPIRLMNKKILAMK